MTALDDILPHYDFRERHERAVGAGPERAVAAFLAGPAAPDPLVAALLRVRGIDAGGTVAEAMARIGLEELAREPAEAVFGASGMPWRWRGAMRPFADDGPGAVRIAMGVSAVEAPGGCVLGTETRICATDVAARTAFGRYWRVVRPFSGLLRRRWLAAVARAERQ